MSRISDWWSRLWEESRPRNSDEYFAKGGSAGDPAIHGHSGYCYGDDRCNDREMSAMQHIRDIGDGDSLPIASEAQSDDKLWEDYQRFGGWNSEAKTGQHIPGDVIHRQIEAYERSIDPEEPK